MIGVALPQLQSHRYILSNGLTRATTAVFETANMARRAIYVPRQLLLTETVNAAPELEKTSEGIVSIFFGQGLQVLLTRQFVKSIYGNHLLD